LREVIMPRLTFFATVFFSAVVIMGYPPSSDPFAASEQARVRAHLDSAERELRAAPVMGLSVSQRAARARALDRLHEYWVRGVFPQNTDFPDERVPYFVDRYGTRCAMAYLIEQSGHGDFVTRVAATRNNARIREIKSDPQLIAWLEANGVTLAEAARIQPEYCWTHPCSDPLCGPCPPVPPASTGYKAATALSVGADVLAVALSAAPTRLSRSLTGALSVATGVVGIAIGAPNFDQSGSRRTLGFVNAGVGAMSAAFGVHRLTGKRSGVTPVSFAPWVSASGAPGLSARLTF
jgi:hypothetical protein